MEFYIHFLLSLNVHKLGRISFEESMDCKLLRNLTEGTVCDFQLNITVVFTSADILTQKHLVSVAEH